MFIKSSFPELAVSNSNGSDWEKYGKIRFFGENPDQKCHNCPLNGLLTSHNILLLYAIRPEDS